MTIKTRSDKLPVRILIKASVISRSISEVRENEMERPGITEETLRLLVDRFYDRVRQDALLGPIFNGAITDWPIHLQKLQAFWSSIMLTSGRYKGQPMAAHILHADDMSPAAFARWLVLWRETTSELLDPQSAAALQEKAERIAESLAMGIAFQRDPAAALSRGGRE